MSGRPGVAVDLRGDVRDREVDARPLGNVTYVVAGWKTNHEDEPPLTRDCKNPLAAAAAVRSLLDVGYVHILIDALDEDGRVAYPLLDTP